MLISAFLHLLKVCLTTCMRRSDLAGAEPAPDNGSKQRFVMDVHSIHMRARSRAPGVTAVAG